jgi:TusA-related sulfurtransferase
MPDTEKIFLDARDLEHPKPLEMAMSSLRKLNENNYFYMIHRKHPIPLLDMAQEQGMNVFSKEDLNGNWHILISRANTTKLDDLLIDIPDKE